jgi:hypothetical protein
MKYTLFLLCIFNFISKGISGDVYKDHLNPQNEHTQKEHMQNKTHDKDHWDSQKNEPMKTGGFINGKATFYFRTGEDQVGCPNVQTFNDNNRYGPCNLDGNSGVLYNSRSKYWVAIKNVYNHCGKMITVYYNNNSINLTVIDECPLCGNNIDMSLDALIELTGSKEAACAINMPLPDIKWKFLW